MYVRPYIRILILCFFSSLFGVFCTGGLHNAEISGSKEGSRSFIDLAEGSGLGFVTLRVDIVLCMFKHVFTEN